MLLKKVGIRIRRPDININMSGVVKRAICFPGQGTQKQGMLVEFVKRFPKVVTPVMEEVDSVLNERFSAALVDQSSGYNTTATEVAQPLLLVYAHTIHQIIKHVRPDISFDYSLGHSLGEYSAYSTSGVLSIADAVWLVRQRGLAMKHVTDNYIQRTGNEISMVALFAPEDQYADQINQFIQSNYPNELSLAIYNAPSQMVLSGSRKAIDALIQHLDGKIKTKDLNVSGPFHSPIMAEAQTTMRQILESNKISFNWPPTNNIVSNISAKPIQSLDEIKTSIVDTLVKPVHWSQSFDYLVKNGVSSVTSIGLGKYARNATSSKDINFVYLMSPDSVNKIN
jgi:malonyl CoA-acyl carrier protein transacylase